MNDGAYGGGHKVGADKGGEGVGPAVQAQEDGLGGAAYEPAKDAPVEVVSCPYFTTEVWDLDKPVRRDLSDTDSFMVVMCVAGEGTVEDSEPVFSEGPDGKLIPGPTKGHTCKIRQGDTVLIPATSKGVRFKPAAGAGLKLVTSYIR